MNDFINIISKPVIGSIIGYTTNYIAIKMMFRPLHEVKIGKFTLPFTPGIIPKNKKRIAKAIANMISQELLTLEDLNNVLLSDDLKVALKEKVSTLLDSYVINNESNIKEICTKNFGKDNYNLAVNSIVNLISTNVYNSLLESNIGDLIADKIKEAAMEKMQGSILGFFGGNSIVETVSISAKSKINTYLEIHGKELVSGMVSKEISAYSEKEIKDIYSSLNIDKSVLENYILNIYEQIITSEAKSFLEKLNISQIVENKINSMDVLDLEKLILSIMKNELTALVNLGAIIGFILGLLNLFF